MAVDIPTGFDELETEEQVEYVQMLWNRIVKERTVPVPQWHLDLLSDRQASRHPETDVDWDDLQADLTGRNRG